MASHALAKGLCMAADAIVASMAAQRRPQRERIEPCGARPGALRPVRLLAAVADLAAGGVRTLPGPQAAGSMF
jgi:hypothetical protein